MSSPPNITITEIDLGAFYEWPDDIKIILNTLLLEECIVNEELLKKWRKFYFIITFDTLISYAMFYYNTRVHTSTRYTPYELVFGKKPIIPSAFIQAPEPRCNYDDSDL